MADLCTSTAKLLKHGAHLDRCNAGPTWPLHVSFCCTSRCTLDCAFCVVKNRDRGVDLDPDVHDTALVALACHGAGAAQYSGGEPLAWPHIDAAVALAYRLGLSVGLQTNGTLMTEHVDALSKVKWVRVGIYSEAQTQHKGFDLSVIPSGVNVQITTVWNGDIDFIRWYADFARQNGVGQARVVMDVTANDDKAVARSAVSDIGLPLVFQNRHRVAAGSCHMAWWKTAVDWHGYFYCCGCFGMQAKDGRIPPRLRIDHLSGLQRFYNSERPHDMGHRCDPCPYAEHNDVLDAAMTHVDDPEFL